VEEVLQDVLESLSLQIIKNELDKTFEQHDLTFKLVLLQGDWTGELQRFLPT